MNNEDTRPQLGTAWMRDRLIEEFRNRPEHSTHDVMVEVIIDKIYRQASHGEQRNIRYAQIHDVRPKTFYQGPRIQRRKFAVDNLKDKELK